MDQTFFKFMLALRSFLIQSISNDLLWKEWETITPNKDAKNMGIHRFARAVEHMQSKLIDKQGCKLITDDVKIRKFLNNIPDIIKKAITLHLTDDMTYNEIVSKSERFEGANRGANAEHTKPGSLSKVLRYTDATSTCLSHARQQSRPGKGQPPQNRLTTPDARSTVSAPTKDCEWY